MDNSKTKNGERPGLDASLIVIGLVLAALANTLDIAAWAQLALGGAAAALLIYVLVRFALRKD